MTTKTKDETKTSTGETDGVMTKSKSMTDLIRELYEQQKTTDEIRETLKNLGHSRTNHYIRNIVFRLRQREGLKPIVRVTPTPQQTPVNNYSDFKDLIPIKSDYIDADGNGDIIISGHKYNTAPENKDKEKLNYVLVGETGTGKTQLGYYVGYKLKLPVFNATFNGETNTDNLLGTKELIRDEDGKTRVVWRDGIITKAVRHGGVLLLDEFNAITPQISFCLFSLFSKTRDLVLYENGGERIKAHPNLLILCTQNEGIAYSGTNEQNAALLGRCIFLNIDYSEKSEKQLVKTGDIVSNELISFAKKQRDAYKLEKYSIPISTRDLIQLSTLIKIYGQKKGLEIFLNKYRNESEKLSIKSLYELEVLNKSGEIKKNDNTTPTQ